MSYQPSFRISQEKKSIIQSIRKNTNQLNFFISKKKLRFFRTDDFLARGYSGGHSELEPAQPYPSSLPYSQVVCSILPMGYQVSFLQT